MKTVLISILVVLAMFQLRVKPGLAVTCDEVNFSLAACIPYLTAGGIPSAPCCFGVTGLMLIAATTADRRAACHCAKAAAALYPIIQEDALSSLPAKCGVQTSFPFSTNTNCDDID